MRFGLRLGTCLVGLAALLAAAVPARADDAVLTVSQVGGTVGVQRDGERVPLRAGDALQEQDLIVTGVDGRVTLRFARHGFLDIGTQAEVGIERLPFAMFAKDLKSVFSVSRGYLRVVWKHPQISTNWPLYIYMAGHRISLTSGEYFFQHDGSEQRACAAAGQLALQAVGADTLDTVKPPACTRLVAGVPPQTTARNPEDWIAVRGGFNLRASSEAVAAVAAPVRSNVINTAPAQANPSPVVPTPIAPPATVAAAPPPVVTRPVAAPAVAGRDPLGLDVLGEEPGVRTSTAARIGPVVSAPVLSAPPVAPRTGVIAVADEPLSYPPPTGVTPRPAAAAAPVTVYAPPPVVAPVAPAAPAATGGAWALNIASYTDAAAAERQAQQLRGSGYAAAVQAASVNGKTWHRVQVRGYASQQAAKAAADDLKTRQGLQGIWIVRPS